MCSPKSFMMLCRVCAISPPYNTAINIFGQEGRKYNIVEKIHRYTSIQVIKNDGLPQRICGQCISNLNFCQTVMESSRDASTILLAMKSAEAQQNFELESYDATDVKTKVEVLCFPDYYCLSPIDIEASEDRLKISEEEEEEVELDGEFNMDIADETVAEDEEEREIINTSSDCRLDYQANQVNKSLCCIFCEESFPDIQGILSHQNAVHQDKVQQCIYCGGQMFCSEETFKSHLLYHFHDIDFSETVSENLSQPMKSIRKTTRITKPKNFEIQSETVSVSKKQIVPTTSKKSVPKKVETSAPKKNVMNQKIKCDLCKNQFKNAVFLTIHKENDHKDQIKDQLKCEYCKSKKIFRNIKTLMTHYSKHHTTNTKVFVPQPRLKKEPCIHCDRLIVSDKMLEHVEINHYLGTELLCRYCDIMFLATGLEQPHMRRETALPFKCNHCRRGFTDEKSCTNHMTAVHNIAAKNQSVICDICKNTFKHKSSVMSHIKRIHLKLYDGSFVCQFCGKEFRRNSCLKTHIQYSHCELIPCKICGKGFSSKNILSHMKSHDGPNLSCKYCGKLYMTKHGLKHHESRHEGTGSVQCFLCTRIFPTSNELEKHAALHAENGGPGLETYQCNMCSKHFSTLRSLKRHTYAHSQDKKDLKAIKLPCSLCGIKYRKQKDLDYHMVTCHTVSTTEQYAGTKTIVEKPVHTCQYCGKIFPLSKNLKDHEAKHRGEKNYSCSLCDSKFYYWTSRKLHLEKYHGQSDGTKVNNVKKRRRQRKNSTEDESDDSGEEFNFSTGEDLLNAVFEQDQI